MPLLTKTETATSTAEVHVKPKPSSDFAIAINKKHILVVVNPYATTVSDRLRHLVIYALQSHYNVTAIDTEEQNHATDIARQAVVDGVDLVVAFGGDGTVNEIANGLAGSGIPMSVLPGGSTNVFARALGIPNDIVPATEHLLALESNFSIHQIDLGCANDRYFTFGSGVGLDATAVKQVDARPWLKAKIKDVHYAYWLTKAFYQNYRGKKPPHFGIVQPGAEPFDAVTMIVQNCVPYTYIGERHLDVCEDVALDSGALSYAAVHELRQIDLSTLIPRILSNASVAGHRRIHHVSGATELTVKATDPEKGLLPLHVDGDFIGIVDEVQYSVHPGALAVVA